MTVILAQGTRKKTRQKHRCVVCDKIIPIGSEANFQTNVSPDWGCCTVYWHTNCVQDFDEY